MIKKLNLIWTGSLTSLIILLSHSLGLMIFGVYFHKMFNWPLISTGLNRLKFFQTLLQTISSYKNGVFLTAVGLIAFSVTAKPDLQRL